MMRWGFGFGTRVEGLLSLGVLGLLAWMAGGTPLTYFIAFCTGLISVTIGDTQKDAKVRHAELMAQLTAVQKRLGQPPV